MKGVRLCTLALFLLGPAPLFCQTSASQTAVQARVLSLENAWNQAEMRNDSKAITALLAPTFVYTDAQGAFMDKAQFLVSISAAGYRPGQIVNEGMKADAYRNVVVVTGSYREIGTDKGKPYLRRGRFTDTWIEQDGQWLCAASQETVIAR
jgi:uncharacterized protein DUF4440